MSRGFPGAAPSQMASRKLLVGGAGLASVGCGGPVPGGAGRSSLTEGRTGRSEKQESKGCWEPGYLPAGGRELGRPPWSGCELGVQCTWEGGEACRPVSWRRPERRRHAWRSDPIFWESLCFRHSDARERRVLGSLQGELVHLIRSESSAGIDRSHWKGLLPTAHVCGDRLSHRLRQESTSPWD